MVFTIYENTADAIPDVIGPVVFKGIGEEVENMDNAAIRPVFIFPDITAFHHQVIAWDLKDIGVHEKNQDIGSEFQLKLKNAPITVFK
jgi:hypothetical protein